MRKGAAGSGGLGGQNTLSSSAPAGDQLVHRWQKSHAPSHAQCYAPEKKEKESTWQVKEIWKWQPSILQAKPKRPTVSSQARQQNTLEILKLKRRNSIWYIQVLAQGVQQNLYVYLPTINHSLHQNHIDFGLNHWKFDWQQVLATWKLLHQRKWSFLQCNNSAKIPQTRKHIPDLSYFGAVVPTIQQQRGVCNF